MSENWEEDESKKDPSHWKMGLFYFNMKDKRLFVPKRFGIGLTLNFGNPGAFLIAAFLIVLICWGLK
jgi:uncharacterized membrane protein